MESVALVSSERYPPNLGNYFYVGRVHAPVEMTTHSLSLFSVCMCVSEFIYPLCTRFRQCILYSVWRGMVVDVRVCTENVFCIRQLLNVLLKYYVVSLHLCSICTWCRVYLSIRCFIY